MSVDEIGAAPLAADARTAGTLRDGIAVAIMLSSAPCLALIFTATGPVLRLIASHFAPGGTAFSVPLIGYKVDGPLFAQLMATMPSVGLMVGGGPTGILIDRLGVRRVLVGALALFAAFGSAGLYIDDAVLLLLSRLGLGFAAVALGSATIWLIGARFAGTGRAQALSWRNIMGGVVGLGSTILAGVIAEAAGFQAVFALFLAPLLLIPFALYAIDPMPPKHARIAKMAGPRESLLFLWPIYLVAVLLAVVMMMNTTQLAFLLADSGILSPIDQSHVMLLGSLAAMAGSVLYAYAGPRLGARGNYTMIAFLLGAGVAIIGLSHGSLLASAGVAVAGFGAGCMGPHFSRLVLDRAPEAARGRAVGLNFSAIYLGDFINPFIVRPIASVVGIHKAFLLIGTVVALSAVQIFVPRSSSSARRNRALEIPPAG